MLVGLASWPAIFWANIPIVIAGLLFGWSTLSEIKPQHSRNHFDCLEIPTLFQNQTFACANGAILFSHLTMYVMLLAIPILMSGQGGWSSLQAGLILAAMSGTIAVFTPVGGRLSDHIGRRKPSIAGIALLLIGVVPLAVFRQKINIPRIIACLWLMGTGLGLSSMSLQTSILESVKLQQAGLVTGISSTSRYVGSIVGSSMLAQVLGASPFEISDFRIVFLMVTISVCIPLLMSWGNHSKRSTK